ncbi:MAG: hypothetical protein K8Q97_01020 [Candidatus Andersenbacteria bacterium]|nr:hypothetical protein [Candidatus Andersenbacteria bacterium]
MRKFVLVPVLAWIAMAGMVQAGFSSKDFRDQKHRIFPKTKVVVLDPGVNCIDGPDVPLVIEVPFDFRIPEDLIWKGPIPKK